MKVTLAILLISCGILESFGQGTVNFGNNSSTALTNSLTMMRVVTGTTFTVALYYAPDGAPDDQNMFQIGAPGNIAPAAGIYFAGTRTTPISTPGRGFALFQVRAWETAFGTSYEAALDNQIPQGGHLALTGKSNCIRVETGDPVNIIPPGALTAFGLQSFSVFPGILPGVMACPVPEPSTGLAAGAGAAMLFASRLFRSRRRK